MSKIITDPNASLQPHALEDMEQVSLADLLDPQGEYSKSHSEDSNAETIERALASLKAPVQPPEVVWLDWSKVKTLKDFRNIMSHVVQAQINLADLPELEPYTSKDMPEGVNL